VQQVGAELVVEDVVRPVTSIRVVVDGHDLEAEPLKEGHKPAIGRA
jgi:hypothetical protein